MSAFTSTFRLPVRAIVALLLGAGAAATAGATPRSTIPSVCTFQLDVGHRYFDGIELMTALLESPRLTLHTDTLGAWAPLASPCQSAGFSLHHRTIPGLTMCISVLPPAADSASEDFWDAYVQDVQSQLGEGSAPGEVADSANSRGVLKVLGGRTREAVFNTQAPEPLAEYHVLVTKDTAIVAFVLRGPAEAVAAARDDFRFFLSRLDRAAK
jgi:hypothetical protein